MRFYLPAPFWPENDPEVALDPAESHHAAAVLRLAPGDLVEVFDGAGRVASATIAAVHKKETRLRLSPARCTPPPGAPLLLAVAIAKGSTPDWIIEKAVELGASDILPLLTQRTVVRLDPASRRERQRKWQRIAVEACKQCGQNWLPRVRTPRPLPEALSAAPPTAFDWPLVASLQPEARPLTESLPDQPATAPARPPRAAVWIGPEGDFTPDEYDLLRRAGLHPVSLGPIILRVETAALACLAILRHEQQRAGRRQAVREPRDSL